MLVEQAIQRRRAHYTAQFTGEGIQDKHIHKMLELANWAPTHKKTEPWRFRVYSGKALDTLIDQICNLYVRISPSDSFNPAFSQKMMKRKTEASHMLVISMKRHKQVPEFEELASTAMAVQNLWLYLSSVDEIGGYWSTPSVVLGPEFHELLEMAAEERCLGLFYLGVLKEEAQELEGSRGDWKDKVQWFKN